MPSPDSKYEYLGRYGALTEDFGRSNSRHDNFVVIHNAWPRGICLDAKYRDMEGGQVHMWYCYDNLRAQQWVFDLNTKRIINGYGKCLDTWEPTRNGGGVHMCTCQNNNPNQHLHYEQSTGQIRNVHGICLDASDRSHNGGKVHMWECNNRNPNQVWRVGTPVVHGGIYQHS